MHWIGRCTTRHEEGSQMAAMKKKAKKKAKRKKKAKKK
jgi:hypothetical protein